MSGLLGPNGQPIENWKSVNAFHNKKAPAPATGEKFGAWGGPDVSVFQMPGGGAIQFDLNQLGLEDFRQMRDHYQINSSLSVLMFLLHQIEFRVVGDGLDKKQSDFYTEQLNNIWTPLVRSKSTAFWAGYSPNILQWENDLPSRRITLSKVKDLMPEYSSVKWKTVDGAGTNKISIYDGITHWGNSQEIPVENTYWYPLLMENGDYRGRKLLKSAFQPWFFSILLHLFANRYYERFGEPTPIGRAPYEDEVRYGGTEMRGNEAMEMILTSLRNRSVVVLPNDKTAFGDETTLDYDYQIEYLESQMRGADFERYMTRLDEEMSLALFTPILMLRTADVGSYNLGTQHNQTYKLMLNAISGDWKYYIDWYILKPMRDFNFGTNAPLPKISFRKLGADNEELIRDIVRAMVAKGELKPDVDQLGEMAGLSLSEVQQLTATDPVPGDPTQPSQSGDPASATVGSNRENMSGARGVVESISGRVGEQVRNAYRKDKLREVEFDLGFQSKFESALTDAGISNALAKTREFYDSMIAMLNDMKMMSINNSESFMIMFEGNADWKLQEIMKDGI